MNKRIPKDTMYFTYRNVNPKGNKTSDCVVRALASAMYSNWDTVYDELYKIGKKYKLMPNNQDCYERYLKDNGWERQKQPRNENNKKLTGKQFCERLDAEYKRGMRDNSPVIMSIGSHHLTVVEWSSISGYTICDIWDCSNSCVGKWYSK